MGGTQSTSYEESSTRIPSRPLLVVDEGQIVPFVRALQDSQARIEAKQDLILKHLGITVLSSTFAKENTLDHNHKAGEENSSIPAPNYQKYSPTTTTKMSLPQVGMRNALWIFNDIKLTTEVGLGKLFNDCLAECSACNITLRHEDKIKDVSTKIFDGIFIFYYIAGGREISNPIKTLITNIHTIFGKVPIRLVLLRDSTIPMLSIQTEEFNSLIAGHECFDIYTEANSYDKLLLFTEKPSRFWNESKIFSVKENYRKLKEYVVEATK